MYIAHWGYCLLEGSAVGLTAGLLIKPGSRARLVLDIALALTGALVGGWFFSPMVANAGLGNLSGALFGAIFMTALGRLISG